MNNTTLDSIVNEIHERLQALPTEALLQTHEQLRADLQYVLNRIETIHARYLSNRPVLTADEQDFIHQYNETMDMIKSVAPLLFLLRTEPKK